MKKSLIMIGFSLFLPNLVFCGEVEVINVKFESQGNHSYRFDVTLQHADTGWDHYADRWEVLSPDGSVLATRVLAHPHVNEQPFTRSLSGVVIPPGLTKVEIRGHDSVHAYGGQTLVVELD